MRTQSKLLLLIGFWGVALVINLVVLGYLALRIPAALQSAAQISIRKQAAASQMRAELRDAEAALYRYLMEGEPGFKQQFEEHWQSFTTNLAVYEKLAGNEREQAWTKQLRANDNSAAAVGHSLITLRDQQSADLQALAEAQGKLITLLDGPISQAHTQDVAYQKAVADMRSSLQDMLLAVTAYMNNPQASHRSLFSEATVRYALAQRDYRALAHSTQERRWARDLDDTFEDMRSIALRLINVRDQQLEAFAQFAAILFHMGKELLVDQIQPAASENLNQSWANLLGILRTIVRGGLLGSLFGFLVALAFTLPIMRQINQGINALLAAADRAAAGELTQAVPELSGPDWQRLGAAFNSMMAELALREQRLRRRLSELEALREVSLSLTSTLDADQLFQTIAEAALRLVSADEVHIFSIGERPEELAFMASAWRDHNQPRQPRLPRPDGLVVQTARSGQAIVLDHASQHPLFAESADPSSAVLAAAGFPLRVANKVVGVLSVRIHDRTRFSAGDTRILDLLADQAAVAIENMRLYNAVAEREQRLQTVLQKLAHVQEEERRLVGLDLHDGLTQLLISANMHLNALEAMSVDWPEDAARALQLGHARLQAAIDEARRVIAELRPAALEDMGLIDGLRQYAATMAQQENWQLTFVTDLPEDIVINPELEVALFRVAQEALTNARKYAHTNRIHLRLALEDDTLVLEIRDWGQGFAPKALPNEEMRLGLLGMKERVAMFDGSLSIETSPGAGVSIAARIPYPVSPKVTSP